MKCVVCICRCAHPFECVWKPETDIRMSASVETGPLDLTISPEHLLYIVIFFSSFCGSVDVYSFSSLYFRISPGIHWPFMVNFANLRVGNFHLISSGFKLCSSPIPYSVILFLTVNSPSETLVSLKPMLKCNCYCKRPVE